jgi:hypothetical protein
VAPPGSSFLADWIRTVGVEPDPGLTEELARRLRATEDRPPVAITELVELRPAYWRRTAPVPRSVERERRQSVGRGLHVRIARAIADPALHEIAVRREGISGRIDVLGERVVEIKTSRRAVADPLVLRQERPTYFEQLGFYCGLLDRRWARLVLASVSPSDDPVGARVFDFDVPEPEAWWREAQARADRLRAAWRETAPTALPRCPWWGRGCDVEAAGICDCNGTEPVREPNAPELGPIVPNEREEDRVRAALAPAGAEAPTPPVLDRFWDLVFPRRTYYARATGRPEGGLAEELSSDDAARGLRRSEVARRLVDALESGPPGEVERYPSSTPWCRDRVACFRGAPSSVRVTPTWFGPGATGLAEAYPHTFLELALRCVDRRSRSGTLLLGLAGDPRPEPPVAAFTVRFEPLEPLARWADDRWRDLAAAWERSDPSGLPACPDWMFAGCPYRDRCGDGPPLAPAISSADHR